ncbi:MAG: orotidine 5'-phosphate decarboxylase [Chloroflexi bacterium]|nr:orotidine 5'-phosphate decarboxylase [Chloroflexota bacterium]
MKSTPMLQVAMDYTSLSKALVMASLVAPEVDIIEIGTPLCKAAGVEAIRAMREICPDKLILADYKTPDVGGLEATMAFDAGADMLTVIGGAAMATVEEAYAVTRKRGKQMLMELTGVRDILARATEWRQIGIDRIVYHREWDAQSAGREWGEDDKATIRQLIDMGYKVTITGGLTMELIPFFADLPAAVLICGRGIREAADPRAAAREMRLAIADIWSDSYSSFPMTRTISTSADIAAKAVRWGVSEMGLSLTVDGTECLGCNSPQRFCHGSRTDIRIPAGVDRQQFFKHLIANISPGESQAVGMDAPGTFYLDVGVLSQINEDSVLGLLSATSFALQKVGQPTNTRAAMTVAHNLLSE